MIALVIDALAVIGAAFVVLIPWLIVDPHKHICRQCGNAWRHLGLNTSGPPGELRADLAHTCRECGTMQRWRTKERM